MQGIIKITRYQSPVGDMILGSLGDKLCICDWDIERRRDVIDRSIRRILNAGFEEGNSVTIQNTMDQLDEYFCGKRTEFTIPVQFAGSEFQCRVWSELMKIPYGTTISYGELARRIRNPKAVRAVASANASNAISILVPCHRVIGSNNKLTGYAGGLDAKRTLINLEANVMQYANETRYSYEIQMGERVRCGVEADANKIMVEVVKPVQTHSCNVGVIRKCGVVPQFDDTDALICLREGMRIGVCTADCVPIVLYASDVNAVAAIHAGWKGSLGGIVDNVIVKLIELGANPKCINAAFGPSICGECYEVSEELAEEFINAGFEDAIVSHRHISLEKVNSIRLIRSGVKPENIEAGRFCTHETPWLPSWRRSPTSTRLLTWIIYERQESSL